MTNTNDWTDRWLGGFCAVGEPAQRLGPRRLIRRPDE